MMHKAGLWLAFGVVAFGVLAFGAVYEWAYTVTAVTAVVAGLISLTAPGRGPRLPSGWLVFALIAIAAFIALQLVPLSAPLLARLSPHTLPLAALLWPRFAVAPPESWSLSVLPASTSLALALFVAFAVFFLGTTRALSGAGVVLFARALTGLGAFVAIVAIVQMPLYRGQIYGFWTPEATVTPFGPFVNHNHFAGWMMMALPLAIALTADEYERGGGRLGSARSRWFWLASSAAGPTLLAASAAVVMAVSLLLANSRSAVLGLMVSAMAFVLMAMRGPQSRGRRFLALGVGVAAFGAVVAIAGLDRVLAPFGSHDTLLSDRWIVWQDATKIVRDFPWFGTGLNTFGAVNHHYLRSGLEFYYSETHNDYLQILTEGGFVFAAVVLATLVALAAAIARAARDPRAARLSWIRTGAVVGMIAVGTQEFVDFSLQMPGNAVLFATLCALAVQVPASESLSRRRRA